MQAAEELSAVSKRGDEIMRSRDIRQILSRALIASGFDSLLAK